MSAQDLEQRARELLAAELEAEGDQSIAIKLRRGDAGMDYSFVAAIRAIVAALCQQPGDLVDDARMARALEAARCGLAPEHVSAIEEAIAAYDPNCGARTVRVVDDANGWKTVPEEPTREMIDAGVMFGTSPNKACMIFQSMLNAAPSVTVVDDAMVGLFQTAREMVEAVRAIPESELLALDSDPHSPSALSVAADDLEAALARAQEVQS